MFAVLVGTIAVPAAFVDESAIFSSVSGGEDILVIHNELEASPAACFAKKGPHQVGPSAAAGNQGKERLATVRPLEWMLRLQA
jgi:hypothetical protein